MKGISNEEYWILKAKQGNAKEFFNKFLEFATYADITIEYKFGDGSLKELFDMEKKFLQFIVDEEGEKEFYLAKRRENERI